ncbi:hypothetical protein OIU76_013956 [Salix suchowensis]|nr:hypothetical protein OIU76_013956 [Salix suchowensis]
MARASGAVRWSLPGVSVLGRHNNNTEIVRSYKLASMGGRADAGRYNLQIKLTGLSKNSEISFPMAIPSSSPDCCPSPIIEGESSTNSPVIQLDLRLEGPQHHPIPDHSDKLNDFLCGLLRDPKSEELAHEYYKKAKEKQGFRPERSMLKLLIRYLIQSEKWGAVLSLADDFKSKIAVLAFDSAMKGYNKLHMYGSTLSVHEKMKLAGIPLDSGCYFQIMKAHHKLGDAERVVEMFNEFESRKLDSKPMILSQIYKDTMRVIGEIRPSC